MIHIVCVCVCLHLPFTVGCSKLISTSASVPLPSFLRTLLLSASYIRTRPIGREQGVWQGKPCQLLIFIGCLMVQNLNIYQVQLTVCSTPRWDADKAFRRCQSELEVDWLAQTQSCYLARKWKNTYFGEGCRAFLSLSRCRLSHCDPLVDKSVYNPLMFLILGSYLKNRWEINLLSGIYLFICVLSCRCLFFNAILLCGPVQLNNQSNTLTKSLQTDRRTVRFLPFCPCTGKISLKRAS